MNHENDPRFHAIKKVKERHTARIMNIPGVRGIGIGQNPDKRYVIHIFVHTLTDEIRTLLPQSLDGHPVVIQEVGEIKPL